MRPLGSGSSPLSRGIHTSGQKTYELGRIIPALAGNTVGRHQDDPRYTDHPRSRGEYYLALVWMIVHYGSSPLSRGILTPNY